MDITEIAVADIRVEKPFSHFFPIHDDTLLAIRIDMSSNGYDPAFPLIIWQGDTILVDGHTRLIAAREAGIDNVPVLMKHFENEDDAILYAFHLQRNRRNLTDDHIIRCLEVLDKINAGKKEKPTTDKPIPAKKESVELRARELGTSKSKIEKARTILEHGDDDIKEQVNAGKTTINKAYQEIQSQRRESGELKGQKTTGLASDARYNKAYHKLMEEIAFLKDENWSQVSLEKIMGDLEKLKTMILEP
ncbi:MAG: ParB/RepB/Spo0J family partition protein [Proteobacteria bacterium]|nr:ParB/RepB/Spo0J family partition protein [Pseudomonadota bacterium]